ncbi:MAG: ABC transporter substrate-binding protein [Spirochaetia bacterium]|nr:ABC transporter substrate-binding protein [Spirochaetia bacterium]
MRKGSRLFFTLFVVVAFLTSMLFVSCQPKESDEGEAEETAGRDYTDNEWTDGQDLSGKTVNIFGAFVDTDAEKFEKSMVTFEEATGIEVEYEGSGDFESLITVRTEGGDPPDVAAFPQPGLMQDVMNRTDHIDLNDWFSEDYMKQQYDQSWLDLGSYKGEMVGVWYRATVKSLVWYSKQVFDQEGYEIPETWDELLALSDQMVADGYTPWSIGIESSGATGWVATDWLEDIMLRTQPPEKYDQWVKGELDFNSPEVKRASKILGDIWFNKDYVLGGRNSILTVPFGDAATALVQDPPRALMHRQANFILGFLPDGTKVGEDVDYFYLPGIDEEEGKPVLGAGDCLSAFTDKPETKAVMKYLTQGISTKAWLQAGGFVSPHKDTPLEWYPSDIDRGYAEILMNADTFRFDASDLMPGQVGAGSFWKGMVDWVSGEDLEKVLTNIDNSWPEE